MQDWLSVELVLAPLLATSITCVGLLANWAATSPHRWYARTAIFLAAILPLLLVPAYEPFVAFALQGAVVACCVWLMHWWRAKRLCSVPDATAIHLVDSRNFRFSMSSLLGLVTLVAAITIVAVHVPILNFEAWKSVVAIGALSGLVTFIATQLFVRKSMLANWLIGVPLCFLAALLLCKLDWFVYFMVKRAAWPPTGVIPRYDYVRNGTEAPMLAWLYVLPTVAMLLTVILLLLNIPSSQRRKRAKAVAEVLIVLVAALPTWTLWQLLHPLPMPPVAMPEPNGYDDLVAAGNVVLKNSPILDTQVEPSSTAQLAAEVAKFSSVYQQIQLGLSRKCKAQPWTAKDLSNCNSPRFSHLQSIRGVARALSRQAELALQQKRFPDAAKSAVDGIRIGEASSRDGLVTDYLVGFACEGMGTWNLYQSLSHLDAASCRQTIASLELVDQNRDPLNQILYRERVLSENTFGWHGHLWLLLQVMTGKYGVSTLVEASQERAQAIERLLMAELALKAYQIERNSLPKTLNDLVPAYLPRIPTDPLDAHGAPLRYKLTTDGYMLYSVGFDGQDNGGTPPPREYLQNWDQSVPADLRLDSYFAPEEQIVSGTKAPR